MALKYMDDKTMDTLVRGISNKIKINGLIESLNKQNVIKYIFKLSWNILIIVFLIILIIY